MLWQFHEPGIALIEEVPNQFGLACASNFLRLRILHIHVTLLIGLSEGPIKDIAPISLDDFLDAVNVPIGAVWLKVGLRASVLPHGDSHVVRPLLFKPEAHSGNKCSCVSLILAFVVEQWISLLQVGLHLTSIC